MCGVIRDPRLPKICPGLVISSFCNIIILLWKMIVTYRRCLSIFALERGEFWSPWSACVESTISRWGMRAPNYESHFHLNATKERANLPMHCAFWSNKDIVSSLNLVHVWKLYITQSFLFLDKCHWGPLCSTHWSKGKIRFLLEGFEKRLGTKPTPILSPQNWNCELILDSTSLPIPYFGGHHIFPFPIPSPNKCKISSSQHRFNYMFRDLVAS